MEEHHHLRVGPQVTDHLDTVRQSLEGKVVDRLLHSRTLVGTMQ
jgi:hypothetical protein